MKKVVFGYLSVVLIALLLFVGIRSYVFSDEYLQPLYKSENGITYCARVQGKDFQLYGGNGVWTKSFLAGVDIGSGKPGYFPGDLAVTEAEYYRWFEQIAAMNATVIRIYIPQTPQFYEALYKYNASASSPLYLIQGIYVDEEEVSKYHNVYADGSHLIEEFDKDITDAVNIIHGRAMIAPQDGKASGSYTYDVSKYVIGWLLGIEWDSQLVLGTNKANPEKTEFNGKYCYTKNASPFEVFLAESAELAIAYETDHYQMQRPVAFCNWPTTDPLTHPNEPNKTLEDAVSVDVEHIRASKSFSPGFFASYHVYPYYPDFMSYDPEYQVSGSNPYREYLKELNAYHSMPVLISEFGLPTSRGMAHTNQVTGLNQGYLNEEEQGKGLVSMLTDIHDTGCMGGIVFSWQDEWFKTTWNTMDFDMPSSRPKWFNVMSSEENFGILAFDPSGGIRVDGKHGEWTSSDLVADNGSEQLSVKSDAAYLYLLAKVGDFDHGTYMIPIDTLSGVGNDTYNGTSFARKSDFLLILNGKDNSRLLIDPYYNPNYKLYGSELFSPSELALYNKKDSGVFMDIEQVISRPLVLPLTKTTVEKQMFAAGRLRYGITDPNSAAYDSLSDFYESNGYVEIRIPWQMLNVADPSSHKILADLHQSPDFTYQNADAFYFGIGKAGAQNMPMQPYTLTSWTMPAYSERLKQSYGILQEDFKQYKTAAGHTLLSPEAAGAIRRFFMGFDVMSSGLKELRLVTYLLCFALSLLFYLFAVLIIVNVRLNKRDRKKLSETERLLSLCNMPISDAATHFNRKYLCSQEGVDALNEILNYSAAWQIEKLKTILRKLGYSNYLSKLLHSRNSQDICLVIKVAAMLNFPEFEQIIVKHMVAKSHDLNLQYTAFLALSLLGCRDAMIRLCMNENYTLNLSYRCLKEIFSAYSGNKRELFGSLLHSTDGYVQRICIKVIGDEGYTEFEETLIPMLETDNVNLLCDVIRTFGQLRCEKAGEAIRTFADHRDWTVRSVAITALGSIDIDKYIETIAKGLFDREWWVRYNTAKSILNYKFLEEVQTAVEQTNDRFAKEILAYVIAENKVHQKAKAGTEYSIKA